jgi:hypothetical protein
MTKSLLLKHSFSAIFHFLNSTASINPPPNWCLFLVDLLAKVCHKGRGLYHKISGQGKHHVRGRLLGLNVRIQSKFILHVHRSKLLEYLQPPCVL